MSRPTSLSLVMPQSTSAVSSTVTSPTDTGSNPPSLRIVHMHKNAEKRSNSEPHSAEDPPRSPEITSLPPFPPSPKDISKHAREPSKGFFSNLKASKSSNKVYQVEPTIRQVSEDNSRSNLDLNDKTIYSIRKNGSTPDLSLAKFDLGSTEGREGKCSTSRATKISSNAYTAQGQPDRDSEITRRPSGAGLICDSTIVISPTEPSQGKKPKPRFGGLLNRTRSMRIDDGGRRSKPTTPIRTTAPDIITQYDGPTEAENTQSGLKTAPLQQDRSIRDMVSSGIRNRSADRQLPSNHSQENMPTRRGDKAAGPGLSASSSGVFRENSGSHLFTNIKHTSSKAADGLGKAGKGIFGKIARSGSSNVKEDERYILKVINLPLVEQTRRTRIAQRLEDSKDKTEFWMPALPWRCIDYLNFRGCEEEGLYRIPGSDLQIRHWQKRFDREGDINLFNENDLWDINIIGSMFKAWLRELPTEILPKAIQAKIARKCAGAREAPQLLKDELSSLPPWNYYLLFAITCHLSLLTAYADKNKMTYSNLCICFQPALKIDAFCFQFLVQDWRNCWQGCWTEKEALEEEYRMIDGNPPSSGGDSSSGSTAVAEERSLPSSGSAKPSNGRNQHGRPPPLSLTKPSEEQLSTPTGHGNENGFAKSPSHLPELAPVMPLSPIGHLS